MMSNSRQIPFEFQSLRCSIQYKILQYIIGIQAKQTPIRAIHKLEQLNCEMTYIEHLADVAVLSGARGKLNGAPARGIVGDEAERIELRRRVFAFRVAFLRGFGND